VFLPRGLRDLIGTRTGGPHRVPGREAAVGPFSVNSFSSNSQADVCRLVHTYSVYSVDDTLPLSGLLVDVVQVMMAAKVPSPAQCATTGMHLSLLGVAAHGQSLPSDGSTRVISEDVSLFKSSRTNFVLDQRERRAHMRGKWGTIHRLRGRMSDEQDNTRRWLAIWRI
jgi:hypothetical protein